MDSPLTPSIFAKSFSKNKVGIEAKKMRTRLIYGTDSNIGSGWQEKTETT